jgi:predicted nucleic-acid-binding protein
MIGIDTNIVVRILTNDDPDQTKRALKLVRGNEVFVSTGVILETAWVLRKVHKLSAGAITAGIARFCGAANVTVENRPVLDGAIEMAEHGVEIADAIHLASANGVEWYATFDQAFVNAARNLLPPVRHP